MRDGLGTTSLIPRPNWGSGDETREWRVLDRWIACAGTNAEHRWSGCYLSKVLVLALLLNCCCLVWLHRYMCSFPLIGVTDCFYFFLNSSLVWCTMALLAGFCLTDKSVVERREGKISGQWIPGSTTILTFWLSLVGQTLGTHSCTCTGNGDILESLITIWNVMQVVRLHHIQYNNA